MNIKEKIFSTFGYDLDIGSGSLSKDDPLVLNDTNSQNALAAEALVISSICRLENKIWNINFQDEIPSEQYPLMLRANVDLLALVDGEAKRETRDFYFYTQIEEFGSHEAFPLVDTMDRSVFPMPYSVGWVFYGDKKVDEEVDGGNVLYQYGNLHTNLTVQVYSLNSLDIPTGNTDFLEYHFKQILQLFENDIKDKQRGSFDLIGDPKMDINFISQEISVDEGTIFLLMTAVKGKVIKIIAQFHEKELIRDTVRETLNAFLKIIRGTINYEREEQEG